MAIQLKKQDDAHAAELQKERDEVSRLKVELEQLKKNHEAEMKQVAAEVKEREEGQAQKHMELVDKAEAHATSVQKDLDDLKGKAEVWMSALNKINSDMAG